jgi:hypothetical protein
MSGVEVIAEVGSIEARGFCSSPLRQPGDVGGHAPGLVAGEQLVGRGVASGGSASAFYAETGTGLIQINIKVFRHGEIGCPSMGGDNDDTFTHGSAAARVRIGNACSSTAKTKYLD